VPFAIGAYITAAYWFTAVDVPAFVGAQAAGAAAATLLFRWLVPTLPAVARDVTVPRTAGAEPRSHPEAATTRN
jgi:hypothetical protein